VKERLRRNTRYTSPHTVITVALIQETGFLLSLSLSLGEGYLDMGAVLFII
jgi:hypothetical protein